MVVGNYISSYVYRLAMISQFEQNILAARLKIIEEAKATGLYDFVVKLVDDNIEFIRRQFNEHGTQKPGLGYYIIKRIGMNNSAQIEQFIPRHKFSIIAPYEKLEYIVVAEEIIKEYFKIE